VVKVEVRNTSPVTREIVTMFEPKYGFLRIKLTDPKGVRRYFKPLVMVSIEETEKTPLKPGESLSGHLLLVYGADGYLLPEPGAYHLQVEMEGVVSNSLKITVSAPEGVDAAALRLFRGKNQGEFLVFESGGLPGQKAMEDVAEHYSHSKYAPYAFFALGRSSLKKGAYNEALKRFNRLEISYPLFELRYELQLDIAVAYRALGRTIEAVKTLKELMKRAQGSLVAKRGEKVLRDIENPHSAP